MKYLSGFLMMFGALGFGVGLLALALALVNPTTGSVWMFLAILAGAGGAELLSRFEGISA